MVFSSVIFLFYFLPIALLLYFLAPKLLQNSVLLLISLLFYAWGEPVYVFLMLLSIALNFMFGLAIDRGSPSIRNISMLLGAAANLSILGYFKYAEFLAANLEQFAGITGVKGLVDHLPLPLGISFFTFQALSYLIDVYRRTSPAQRNPFRVALYIALFPQLIAGPIVRYNTISDQLAYRTHSLNNFADGLARFIIGLGKKVLIANTLAAPADSAFMLGEDQLSPGTAWLGIVCYSLQIYYDFSGYSDMAIGIGRMIGFEFPENFRHPYAATSIREFWRRWHISLSTWFRDYLYIPLGGSRMGDVRTAFNLVLVFFLCGLWHGANWTFVIWGLFHGLFLALERTRFGSWVERSPRGLKHAYVAAVFMAGWVLFRAESFNDATHYFRALVGFGVESELRYSWQFLADNQVRWTILLAIPGCAPIWRSLSRLIESDTQDYLRWRFELVRIGMLISLVCILVLSALQLMSDTYNPFIYFRF